MEQTDTLSHTGMNNSTSDSRIIASGYPLAGRTSIGENVGRQGSSLFSDTAVNLVVRNLSFLFASAGHRENTLKPTFKQIGIGFTLGSYVNNGRVWLGAFISESYGSTSAEPEAGPSVLGVCFGDANQNGQYDPGEGIPSVEFRPARGAYYTKTSQSGGYAVPVPSGANTIDIRCPEIGHLRKYFSNVQENTKLDIDKNRLPQIGMIDQGEVSIHGGQPLLLEASTNGIPRMTQYRWLKEGFIVNEGSSALRVDSVTPGDAGRYELEVQATSDPGLYVVLQVAVVTVLDPVVPPKISQQPVPLTVEVGAAATFTVGADGEDLGFQWEKDGDPVPGQESATLIISSSTPADAGRYRVIVSNPGGSVMSRAVDLAVLLPLPVIVGQPTDQNVAVGEDVLFRASATGEGLTYQWVKDDAALEGKTEPQLALSNVQLRDAGHYRLIVSNPKGTVATGTATLTVAELPEVPELVKLFEEWAATARLLTGEMGDDDGDGLTNLVEFVLARSPHVFDPLPLPRLDPFAQQFEWSMPRNLSVNPDDVTIDVMNKELKWVDPQSLGFQLVRNQGRVTLVGATRTVTALFFRLRVVVQE